MNSRPLMLLRLDTSATEEIGSTPRGALSIFPVTGGSFEGERLRGKVLAGGGDWRARRCEPLLSDAAVLRDRRAPICVPQSFARSGHWEHPSRGTGSRDRGDSLKRITT